MQKLVFVIAMTGFILCCLSTTSGQSWQSDHVMTATDGFEARTGTTVDQLSWIAGTWRGEGLGGQVEEIWSRPSNGHMLGLFRYESQGTLNFSEYCMISQRDEGIVLMIKHFNEDFTGWEEKDQYVTFRLLKLEGETAYFDGATMERKGDVLTVYVVIGHEGEEKEEAFIYHLVNP